jgi:hypothetical protein
MLESGRIGATGQRYDSSEWQRGRYQSPGAFARGLSPLRVFMGHTICIRSRNNVITCYLSLLPFDQILPLSALLSAGPSAHGRGLMYKGYVFV